ncbi:MAG TPA: hypothetical protein VFW94_23675 [Candidatus Acidoferrales bacterium]|nr:hypothetical protein [Candidatus Acidoferrales bacterium]
MGTRHLTCVYQDGQYKLAQYGQWDGYPSGQGVIVLAFLRDRLLGREDRFIERLNACFTATKEQVEQWYREAGNTSTDGWINGIVAEKFTAAHPSLSRDTGAAILALIMASREPVPLHPDLNFAADSLFCEFLYLVDLDKRTFEVYTGFNTEPLTEADRFFFLMEKSKVERRGEDQYYPVKLLISFSLDSLPEEQAFLEACEQKSEDEAEAKSESPAQS